MSEAVFCDPLDKNDHTLSLIAQFSVIFSLAGSLFVILMYSFFKNSRNFTYKLILQISISDFIYCISHFYREQKYFSQRISPGTLCTTQAFFLNFGLMASLAWVLIVSWTLYSTVVLEKHNIQNKFRTFAVLGYGLPFIFSLM